MVVNSFHIFRAGIGPAEAQPPLIVNANAVLADAIAPQLFESMTRR
jgi:hypothetical protein